MMQGFLDILLSFPTIAFTVPMGVVFLYWLSVLLGAVDLELGDGVLDGALDGAVDGALDGAVDGALDGAVDGALDGAVDGALDGAVDGVDVDLDGDISFLSVRWLASGLRLGKVPLTVTGTLFVFGGWCASFMLALAVRETGIALPMMGTGAMISVASVLVASAFTNVASRPIEPVFTVAHARERSSLLGETCEVSTGRVDDQFGQGTAMIGGDDLLFQIRCAGQNGLKRGDKALIVSFDAARQAFVIEPLSAPGWQSSSDAARRGHVRSAEEH
jgi:hypothetical protein